MPSLIQKVGRMSPVSFLTLLRVTAEEDDRGKRQQEYDHHEHRTVWKVGIGM